MFDVRDQQQLGRPFGIPLSVDRIVLIFVGGFTLYFVLTRQPAAILLQLPLIYLSIYAHELAHALATLRLGGQVDRITLHLFGGLTHIRQVQEPWREIVVSAAGPLTNIAIGALLKALLAGGVVPPGAGHELLDVLANANLLWGAFNLVPLYPLDGGQILFVVVSRRLSRARAIALSALTSLVAIGMIAVFAVFAFRSIFLIMLLGFLGWINVQRWMAAKQAGATAGGFLASLRERAGNGKNPPRRRASPATEASSLRELAGDTRRVRKLLRHGIRVGLGGLTPGDRRLIMFHRTLLEAELTRSGFDSLTAEDRELLALHHEMDDRSAH